METIARPAPIAYDRVPDTIWSRFGYGVTKTSAASSHRVSSTRPTKRSTKRTCWPIPSRATRSSSERAVRLAFDVQQVRMGGAEDDVAGRRARRDDGRESVDDELVDPCPGPSRPKLRITSRPARSRAGLIVSASTSGRFGTPWGMTSMSCAATPYVPVRTCAAERDMTTVAAAAADELQEDRALVRRRVAEDRVQGGHRGGVQRMDEVEDGQLRRRRPRCRTRAGSRRRRRSGRGRGPSGRSRRARRAGCGGGPRGGTGGWGPARGGRRSRAPRSRSRGPA